MSTIKVTNIKSGSTDDGGIAIDATGHVQVDGVQMPTAGALSNRNLIINGAMNVAQRGTQVTGVTTQGYRTCDRFDFNVNALGTWTVDQDTNAPNGFSNSLKVTCTTADASPASTDYLMLQHFIEAQNLQLLGFGTADAKATTLSFWVKSNKTGNASIAIRQPDNSGKQVTYQYSISSADTWEYKTIAIPADTAGVINNDNGQGLKIEWWLNGGSDYTGGSHPSTWTASDNTDRNASNFGLGGATSDYWQITGVQLEVGEKATPFEHRSYGDELARCQRYYCHYGYPFETIAVNARIGTGYVSAPTQAHLCMPTGTKMRTDPDVNYSGMQINDAAVNRAVSSVGDVVAYNGHVFAQLNCSTGLTEGRGINLRFGTTTDFFYLDAEL